MKYDAFISYSHSDCGTIAPAIQKAIENIGKPWYKLSRNLNVFRDETNLGANPHLWENIEKALDDSKNFILLASPKACESDWVTKEIEKWEEKDPSFQKFNIAVTSGEIFWDKISNDFNWEKTTCLPKCLKEKFQSEPLYIDLKDYLNKNNRPIDYNLPGFTSGIVKIIAGVKGVEPREIESDEKKRKNNTILSLTIGVITLVSISLLGYMFYRQKEINERYAITNNLIAQGNDSKEENISKSLLYYFYAYKIHNSKENYKILNDFYNSIILNKNLQGGYYKSFTINKFPIVKYLYSHDINEDEAEAENVISGISPQNNLFFVIKDSVASFYDLGKNKFLYKLKLKGDIIDYNEEYIVYNQNNNLMLYNIRLNTIKKIAVNGVLYHTHYNLFERYYNRYSVFINKNSLIFFKRLNDKQISIFLYNAEIEDIKKYIINVTTYTSEFKLINYFEKQGKYFLHFTNFQDNSNYYSFDKLVNLSEDLVIFENDISRFIGSNDVIKSIYNNGLIINAKKNGNITVADCFQESEIFFEKYAPTSVQQNYGLSDFIIYKDYLISGYEDGKVNFYLLYGNDEADKLFHLQWFEIPIMNSIHIENGEGLNRLKIYNGILYISTSYGNIFKIDLNQTFRLSKDLNILQKQINKILENFDLSKEEKDKFKINNS